MKGFVSPAESEQASTHNWLRSTLWNAANTLRGSAVDRTDWKGYILPLLFFKRISDVWDERRRRLEITMARPIHPCFPRCTACAPRRLSLERHKGSPANVGAALQKAMQEIERANPDTLFRVFGSADWGNKEKFSDELLKDLIEGFSEIGSATPRQHLMCLATPTNTWSARSPTSPPQQGGRILHPAHAWCA